MTVGGILHCKSSAFYHKLEVQAQLQQDLKISKDFNQLKLWRLLRFPISTTTFVHLVRGSASTLTFDILTILHRLEKK